MSHRVHPPATRWPLAARKRGLTRGSALAAALLHAIVLVALVFGMHRQPSSDAARPAPIEVVLQPVTATAPTPPAPQPASAPAAAAVPNAPAITPQTVVAAAPDPPLPAMPMPTAPALPPPPESPIAPTGPQAELPPPAPPSPSPPAPAPAVSMPVVPVPAEAHEQQRVRERPQHVHHEAPARPHEPDTPRQEPSPASASVASSAHAEVTAPTTAPATPASAQAAATWRDRLAAWLSAHKSYPEAAREASNEGVVVVRFTVARDGRVLAVALVSSSGHRLLDEATEAMLRDATVPALPPEMPQSQETVTVPLRYSLVR